jgi:hypothetical protein
MKIYFYFVISGLLLGGNRVYGQADYSALYPNLRQYIVNIRFITKGLPVQSGVLFDLTDSTIVLASIRNLKPTLKTVMNQHGGSMPATDSLTTVLSLRTYRYAEISRLTLHRKGYAGKGFLIGFGLGALIGLIDGDDDKGFIRFSAGEKALILGLTLAPVGLLGSALTLKSAYANERPIATEAQKRFLKFTIIEQIKKANLYAPQK